MPEAIENFQQVQRSFSLHLRDPEHAPAPVGIEDRRMQIYRRLFYNNILGFLAQAFPVLRLITEDEQWHKLMRRFYAQHRCRRPQFYQLAEEFLEFLQEDVDPGAPAFRLELAHYEWMELVLAIDPAAAPAFEACKVLGESARPVFSPWLEVLTYQWPVHQIGPDNLPDELPQQVTCLLVFRTLDEDVSFLQINVLTARLIELLRNEGVKLQEALEQVAQEAQLPAQQVLAFGTELVADLIRRGVILGQEPSSIGD
ncbi:MAG: HvfC family RiPP maturation protein [Oceanococcus sp.]